MGSRGSLLLSVMYAPPGGFWPAQISAPIYPQAMYQPGFIQQPQTALIPRTMAQPPQRRVFIAPEIESQQQVLFPQVGRRRPQQTVFHQPSTLDSRLE